MTKKWTEEGYWDAVMGDRCAIQVVNEFELVPDGLSAWLGEAEEEAISEGGLPREATLSAWERYHATAIGSLEAALATQEQSP